MTTNERICMLVIAITLTLRGESSGAIIEVGDLNIINDGGNPSDGLRFLDMSFSDGLTQVAALSNAQLTYPNTRLATPSEFDDLFAAAGIGYNGTLTASDGFEVGTTAFPTGQLSSGVAYDGGVLQGQLGETQFGTSRTLIWTDPDGQANSTTTRDLVVLTLTDAQLGQTSDNQPNIAMGWLLVSEVPEPSSLIVLSTGLLGLVAGSRHRRRA